MRLTEGVGVPAGSPTVEIDGVSLAYAREGRGPAIVCLHAIGHGGRDFEGLARAIRDQFETIWIDWPGQGRSGRDANPASAARYAELLRGVLDALKVERPIILGNSIGGAAAILYASTHPVRALVLCNSGGLVEVTPEITRACGTMSRFFAAGARGAWWFGSAFWAYYRLLVLPSRAARTQRKRIIAAGYEIAPVLRDAWLSFGRPEADIRAQASALDIPIWVAWAKGDKILQLKRCLPAIRRMRRAQISRFRGGHGAFLEQPAQFVREFRRFVATLDSPR